MLHGTGLLTNEPRAPFADNDPDSVIDGPDHLRVRGSWREWARELLRDLLIEQPISQEYSIFTADVTRPRSPEDWPDRFVHDLLYWGSPVYQGYDNTSLRPTFHFRDCAIWWRKPPASDEKKARRAVNRAAKHEARAARMQRDAARKAQQRRARHH